MPAILTLSLAILGVGLGIHRAVTTRSLRELILLLVPLALLADQLLASASPGAWSWIRVVIAAVVLVQYAIRAPAPTPDRSPEVAPPSPPGDEIDRKIEALGRVTSAIAHDLNNLLFVVSGHVDLARSGAGAMEPDQAKALDQIEEATRQIHELGARLMAFGRKTVVHPEEIDLASWLEGSRLILQRLTASRFEMTLEVEEGVPPVRIDREQLMQTVLRVLANAAEAQAGDEKTAVVRLRSIELPDPELSPSPDATPGHYVLLEVEDPGAGMAEELVDHAFEPYVTDRSDDPGRGWGLPLAWAAVKRAEGHLTVSSTVGKGTRVRVFLPVHA